MSQSHALNADRKTIRSEIAGDISYYFDSSAQGTPLLLLHSINAAPSAIEMKPLFDYFRRYRPVYAPDLPGFGCSDRSDRTYNRELYKSAIIEFQEKVIGLKSDIIALSLTSEFAAEATIETSFKSLVMISPTGLDKRKRPSKKTSARINKFLSLPVIGSTLFKKVTCKASISFFLNQAFSDKAPQELKDYAYITSHQPGASRAPFAFLSGNLFSEDAVKKVYEKLSLPTLVIYDQDPNIGFSRLSNLLETNPMIKEAIIKPSHGLPHWEHPEKTQSALKTFWSELK